MTRKNAESGRAAITSALLGDFAQQGHVHELRVLGVPETLFIVPTAAEAERLARGGVSRGRIWTARELADLVTAMVTATDFSAIALTKLIFDGELMSTLEQRTQQNGEP